MITIYYDFECSFCYRAITRSLIGSKVEIKLSTIQEISNEDEFFSDLSIGEIYSSMWLVDPALRLRKRGYFAFKYLFTHLHKSRFTKAFFLIPFFSDFFGSRIYELVARNRRLAGCNSQSCSIHSRNKLEE